MALHSTSHHNDTGAACRARCVRRSWAEEPHANRVRLYKSRWNGLFRRLTPHRMDRIHSHRPMERHPASTFPPPPHAPYPPPLSQPSYQMPPSDPFHTNRDPFIFGAHGRRDSLGQSSRAWQGTAGKQVVLVTPARKRSKWEEGRTHTLPRPSNGRCGQGRQRDELMKREPHNNDNTAPLQQAQAHAAGTHRL